MPQPYRYLFKIDAYTPKTIPMARLAQYMGNLAAMMGNQGQVHFVELVPGSTVLVNEVEFEAEPKVRERLRQVRAKEGPEIARTAYASLNDLLSEDNASAELVTLESKHAIMRFPGRKRPANLVYGPFNQEGSIDGVLIRIGGQGDSVPVHLQEEGDIVHVCEARREVAVKLAPYYLQCPLRVSGTGRWFRDMDGHWEMKTFRIVDFVPLKDERLSESLNRIRSIKDGIAAIEDPLSKLRRIRNG